MRRRGREFDDVDDDVEEPDDFKFWPRDTAIDQTKQKLIQFFAEHPDGIYYDQQLRVLFEERPYKVFQWITGKALTELREERALKSALFKLGTGRPMLEAIGPGTRSYARPAVN
jgi:hypothetical protein